MQNIDFCTARLAWLDIGFALIIPLMITVVHSKFLVSCVVSKLSYLLTYLFMSSGSTRAVKEPGHFSVTKSSSQVTWMHFFHKKS